MESFPALLETLGPDLFRRNSFRVAGLPVNATARQVTRQFDRLRLLERLGSSVGVGGAFPLQPAPDGDALRAALDRLRDPERRFLDDFFWFWPTVFGDNSDPAISSLDTGQVMDAVRLWAGAERRADGGVARHNLAVLYHLLALDMERPGPAGSPPLSAEAARLRDLYWENAWKHWRGIHADDGFWATLAERVRRLEEPQLTAATVDCLRRFLPEGLLGINAQLAARAVEAGQEQEAARQRSLLVQSGFSDAVEAALRAAVQALCTRLRLMSQQAAAETDADPAKGFSAAQRLHKFAQPLLATLRNLLPPQHPLAILTQDEVAAQVKSCAIIHANRTHSYDTALWWLLKQALEMARGETTRVQIRADIEVVKENSGIPRWVG
jgi:hypothetical protein